MVVWFFFFQHKTAYEVRISDWSSDVCSSDLLKTALVKGGLRRADAEALRQAVGRHRSAVSAAANIMTCAQETQVSPSPMASPGLARLRAARKADRRGQWEEICRLREQGHPTSASLTWSASIGARSSAGSPMSANPNIRSAEHTSELQSLMRISYD